jgi:tRNA pseudouridine55 synthase
VRTLIHDLGARLGCGAAMAALRRAAIGEFRADDAVTLDGLEERLPEERAGALIPLSRALFHLPVRQLTPVEVLDISHGRAVSAGDVLASGVVALLNPEGELAAMARVAERDGALVLAPEKVFVSADATR